MRGLHLAPWFVTLTSATGHCKVTVHEWLAVYLGRLEEDMNGKQVCYVCTTPEHVAVAYPKYPHITLFEGQWAMCMGDGRVKIAGSHHWKVIEPAPVEMLAFGRMARRSV